MRALALGLVLAFAEGAGAAEIDPGVLDDAETNVCAAHSRLQQAMAAASEARSKSIPVEQLGGQPIDDPARRAFLEKSLTGIAVGAQDSLVKNSRDELARYQSEYTHLTGAEFDTALCRGGVWRNTHREAAARLFSAAYLEQSRREYAQLVQAYQRQHGKAFDPAVCR
ncbi:MAG: hypothetical protein ACRET4_19280 [Steroidobacteraceae bacterium]